MIIILIGLTLPTSKVFSSYERLAYILTAFPQIKASGSLACRGIFGSFNNRHNNYKRNKTNLAKITKYTVFFLPVAIIYYSILTLEKVVLK